MAAVSGETQDHSGEARQKEELPEVDRFGFEPKTSKKGADLRLGTAKGG